MYVLDPGPMCAPRRFVGDEAPAVADLERTTSPWARLYRLHVGEGSNVVQARARRAGKWESISTHGLSFKVLEGLGLAPMTAR